MNISSLFLAPDARLRASWRAFLFAPLFLILFVPGTGLLLVVFDIPVGTPEGLEPAMMIQGITMLVAAFLPAWLLLRFADGRSFSSLGIGFYPGWGRDLGGGLLFGLVLNSGVVVVLWLSDAVSWSPNSFSVVEAARGLGWYFVLLGPAAAAEEVLFRGYFFQRLVEGWGAVAAVVLLSVLFGWGHVGNPDTTLLSTANTVLMGILLALAYLKTRALWFPIGLHFSWNFVMAAVYSLPVSGIVVQRQLLVATISGPDWLSGGNYGPEGSVLTTAAALLAILWLARTRRLRVSPAQAKEVELARAGGEP